MSSDRRPASVRVVSSGQEEAPASGSPTPMRRRGDKPQGEELDATVAAVAGAGADAGAASGSLGGTLITLMLFLAGCAIGGALLIMSGLVPVMDL